MREPRDRSGPARKVSLRSRAGGVDCSAIARERGGGGHPGAAGFSTDETVEEIVAFLERAVARVNAAVLLVDKPAGPTSFGCVARVRGALGGRRVKVGHAGTLDPFATGLLALLVGRATRLAPYLVGLDKRYRTVVQLGVRSDTGDPEGELEPGDGAAARSPRRSPRPAPRLVGRRSAGAAGDLRDQGRRPARLRARARRRGRSRCRRARSHVHALDVVSYDAARGRAVLDVHCSKGTYVRALARDLGETLGCGAYCAELRRLAIGHLDDRARGVARRRRGGSARRRLAHALQRRARAPARARARARPSATRCCTAAPSRRAARTGPLRCLADGRLVCVAGPRGDELRSLVVVDEE